MLLRIYEILVRLFEFISNYLKKKEEKLTVEKVSLLDKYILEKKETFLRSYENELIDWNESINDEKKDKWKSNMLFESTPRGNIMLMYDFEKSAFIYYMDCSGVSYVLLNAVAMKFVTTFRCRDFFVDENIIPQGKISPLITAMILNDKKENDEKNMLVNNLTNCVINDVNSPFEELKSRVQKRVSFDAVAIKIKIQNKFINRGKMNNIFFHQKTFSRQMKVEKKTSYESYKRSWQMPTPIESKISHEYEFDFCYDVLAVDSVKDLID
jgi:hypothetical protein